jgi:hypothetical protein
VLRVSPNGRSYVVDWIRTNLIAGITTARVMAPDGREFPLPARSDALWPLMNLLVSYGLSNPTPVLDLRKRRMRAVAGAVMEVVRDKGRAGPGPGPGPDGDWAAGNAGRAPSGTRSRNRVRLPGPHSIRSGVSPIRRGRGE